MKNYILTVLLSGFTFFARAQSPEEDVPVTYRYTTLKTEAVTQPGVRNETHYSALSDAVRRGVISYYDGFGRPVSQFALRANPDQHDVITLFAYDKTGKADTAYLPYAANLSGAMGNRWLMINAQQGFYNTTANTLPDDTAPFAVRVYENTPGTLLKEQGAPGAAWQPGGGHTSTIKNITNTLNEIRIWREDLSSTAYYAAGTLAVQYATDENGNVTKLYVDKSGRVIEKHVQVAASQWLITRNIYDRAGRLTYVVQPEGVSQVGSGTSVSAALTEQQTFQYTYDNEGRVVEMKAPGTAPVYYGYDPLGRLVLTQDGNQRAANKWIYIKYDRQGRPVMSGLYLQTTHTTRSAVQLNVLDVLSYSTGETFFEKKQNSTTHGYTNQSFPTTNTEVLTVNYYDDYDVSADGTPDYSYTSQGISGEGTQFKTSGALTATKSLIPGTSQWLYAYIFYDQNGRVIQQRTNNQLSATVNNLVTTVYDFEGKIRQTKTYHSTPIAQVTVVNRYEYDPGGRMTQVFQKNNTDAEVLVCSYSYNELGILIDKKLHSTDAGISFLQSIDYRHNIRGWLTSINNAQLTSDALLNDDDNDFFGMELLYNTTTTGLNSGTGEQYYNGNISAVKWQGVGGSGSEGQKSYKLSYDKADRLLQATYGVKTASAWTGEANAQNETMTYDRNGNIKTLVRTQRKYQWPGMLPEYTSGPMDDLTYTFADAGNRLVKVQDAAPGDAGLKGFADGAAETTEYTYDISGNLTADKNKGIDSVKYTVLGKVSRVKFSDGRLITYRYSAGGVKLTQKNYQGSTLLNTTHYVNGFVYENDTLRFFGSPEGRVVKTNNALEYQYAIADHQGNTRVVFSSVTPDADITDVSFEGSTNGSVMNYSNRNGMSEMNHTPSGTYSQLLHGGYSSQVGAAKTIHVYPGDTITAQVFAKYRNVTATAGNLTAFATALSNAFGVTSGSVGEALNAYTGLQEFGGIIASGDRDDDALSPKGFITIMLFDKHHNFLDAAWDQLDEEYVQTGVLDNDPFDHLVQQMVVKEEGYAYIFLSNENPTKVDIHFDDLKITHGKTNVIQYNEYYPFGLQTAGSWTRSGTKNDFKYNAGTELNEVNGWYEAMYRGYDAALGRFLQVDPLASKYVSWTPYAYAYSNPMRWNDPTGLSSDDYEVAMIYIWMNRYGGSWSERDGLTLYDTQWQATYSTNEYIDRFGGFGGGGYWFEYGEFATWEDGAVVVHSRKSEWIKVVQTQGNGPSPWQVGWEWLTGTGPRHRDFGEGDTFLEMLKQHDHIEATRAIIRSGIANGKLEGRNNYNLGGVGGVGKYLKDYSTLLTGGLTGNLAVTYLGSYGLNYKVTLSGNVATILFTVNNSSTIESATHPPVIGYTQWWSSNIGQPLNNALSTGPMSRTTQTFQWTETMILK